MGRGGSQLLSRKSVRMQDFWDRVGVRDSWEWVKGKCQVSLAWSDGHWQGAGVRQESEHLGELCLAKREHGGPSRTAPKKSLQKRKRSENRAAQVV